MPYNIWQKTKIGMFWNAFEKIAIQGISFGIGIVLARLLNPHDYGTIGMLIIFLTFSYVFIDSGFSRALIQKQDRTEEDFSTVLIFNIAVSCLLYVILFLASPVIADFYETPELVGLQRVFFIVLIINSLSVVQSAKLQASSERGLHVGYPKRYGKRLSSESIDKLPSNPESFAKLTNEVAYLRQEVDFLKKISQIGASKKHEE